MVAPIEPTPPPPSFIRADRMNDPDDVRKAIAGIAQIRARIEAEVSASNEATADILAKNPERLILRQRRDEARDKLFATFNATERALRKRLAELGGNE